MRGTCTGASTGTAPVVQGAARRARRRAAGARLPARPEGPVRAHLRLLRPARPVDPRSQDPHDARTATRSTRSRSTIRRNRRTPRIATRSRSSSSSSTQVLTEQRAARAADRSGRIAPASAPLPADARGADLSRRPGNALHPRNRGRRPARASRAIAYTLAQANINVVSAKINTLGERAEDVVPHRRRAAARRAGALAPRDRAVRAAADLALLRDAQPRGRRAKAAPRSRGTVATGLCDRAMSRLLGMPGMLRAEAWRLGTARVHATLSRIRRRYSSSGALSGNRTSVKPKRESRACASDTGCRSGGRTRAGPRGRGNPLTSRPIGWPCGSNPS